MESYGGRIVQFEADNALARFDEPGSAVRGSIALNLAFDSANLITDEGLDVHVACGIDHGNCLAPTPHNLFGLAVNRASRLGEDLGDPGEILITEEALAQVPASCSIQTCPAEKGARDVRSAIHRVIYRPA